MAINVTLREKKIKNDKLSLFLDFYPPITKDNKETRREFLKLYTHLKPKSKIEREHNKETLKIAEAIRYKRYNILNKPEAYTRHEKELIAKEQAGNSSFKQFYIDFANKKTPPTKSTYLCVFKAFCEFHPNDLTFNDINKNLILDFKDFLHTYKRQNKQPIATNTVKGYFTRFKSVLKGAHLKGYIQTDFNSQIPQLPSEETKRDFLTLDELNKLAQAPCKNDLLKRASLFSALTGLRYSDIRTIQWGQIRHEPNKGYEIHFRQQKTKQHEVLPISEQAYSLLGEHQTDKEKIFPKLNITTFYTQNHLKPWVRNAGILKNITFHCFRHTYATLQLSQGTDIYTVSKMLGHRSLKTTEIYANLLDENKREASNKIRINL